MKTQTIVRLPSSLKSRAQAFCEQSEVAMSMNTFIQMAMLEKLEREEGRLQAKKSQVSTAE